MAGGPPDSQTLGHTPIVNLDTTFGVPYPMSNVALSYIYNNKGTGTAASQQLRRLRVAASRPLLRHSTGARLRALHTKITQTDVWASCHTPRHQDAEATRRACSAHCDAWIVQQSLALQQRLRCCPRQLTPCLPPRTAGMKHAASAAPEFTT